MIFHIFKKDIGILWPFAFGAGLTDLVVAMLHVAAEAVQFRGDLEALNIFLMAGDFIAFLFGFVIIAMVVQLDPIPGERQDWLARPIRRRDVFSAKLLFIVIFVQLPILVADALHGMGSGFPLGQSLVAAGARNLYLFLLMTLPVMALATMTNGIKQTLALGLAASVGALAVTGGILELYSLINVTSDGGHSVASFALQMALLLTGAIAILGLQYFCRATNRSRVVLASAALLAMAAHLLLPQDAAYAMEGWLSRSPGQDVSLTFLPQLPALRSIGDRRQAAAPGYLRDEGVLVALPLMVKGVPQGLMLLGDTVRATLTAPDGNSVRLEAQGVPMQASGPSEATYYQMLRVPNEFFAAYGHQALRLNLDYELSILRGRGTYDIAATGGELRVAGFGRCATSLNPSYTAVLLRCLQAGEEKMRVSAALTNPVNGLKDPVRNFYSPSDAPYRNGDAIITRFNATLPFRNIDIAARYPVNASQLPTSVVEITASQPLSRLTRHVVIPNLRLGAWMANASG